MDGLAVGFIVGISVGSWVGWERRKSLLARKKLPACHDLSIVITAHLLRWFFCWQTGWLILKGGEGVRITRKL